MCFSFDEIKIFRWLVRGVFWSVLKVCRLFSALDFSNVACWALSMQSNFNSYNRVSSSVSSVASIDEITVNSSENHIDRFPRFSYVNCLLIFYSVYCNSWSFKNDNRAFYCNCSSVAPLLPEIFCGLWLAETRKNLNIFSCIHVIDLVLKYGSDINEGKWLQLLFYFIVLMGTAGFVIGMSFFFSCVSGCRLKFSRIAILRKRLQLDSKTDLTTNGLILGFFVGRWLLSLTSYLYGLKSARIAQLLFFFDEIKFFRCLVWGVFWSVL